MDQSLKIHSRILSVDETEHSIVVRYWTDEINENVLATAFDSEGNISRNEDGTPVRCRTDFNLTVYKEGATEEEILDQIARSAPVEFFKLKMRKPTESLSIMKGRQHSFEHKPLTPKVDTTKMTDDEIDAHLSKMAVKRKK